MTPFITFMGVATLVIVAFAIYQAYHAWVYRRENDQQEGGIYCDECGCFHQDEEVPDSLLLEALNRTFNTGHIVIVNRREDGTFEVTECSEKE